MKKLFKEDCLFLVTGGAGFIGSNICEHLLKLGYKVRCLDNLSNGKLENIQEFLNHPKFEFIKGDIRDYTVCNAAMSDVKYLIHQAAWGSVPRSIDIPVKYCENNILGFVNVIEAARKNQVNRIVYASSSSVYGDIETLMKREGVEGECKAPYALTKKINEEWAQMYANLYGIEMVGLRYFNVFGPKQNPNGEYAAVIPKFILNLLNNDRPIINGDGTQARDFTYVMNVVDANIKACFADKIATNRVYNIATGTSETLNELYNMILKELRCNINPIYGPERKGDIKYSLANIELAQKYLGYHPTWSFEKGLKETIKWYLSQRRTK